MDRYERILTLHRLLRSARYPVALPRLMDELGCSRATVYRDVAFLRDGLGAPVETSEDPPGFHYSADEAERFELPGLWLTSDELHALLAAHQLLARTGPGVLSSALAPLKTRIDSLLAEQAGGKRFPMERLRVIASGTRRLDEAAFRHIATAVLERQVLAFDYRARSTDAPTRRTVSPQRLTHYRDNWYLDAWDHEREGLRSFALDRIRQPRIVDGVARDLGEAELDQHLASSYGIFSGAPKAVATIRFSPHAARWVADERWHSKQEGHFLPDGSYELKIPYSNPRELLMDVLRYGADAEVLDPPSLRSEMQIMLNLAMANYGRQA
ncbi:helix-turn-helix transcriptional regulator [Chiayiivirga flava]|uniref:Putative DNA-binding transcriptional regulator YafY n=1 Tax=Chiayiivirga flava TaxID=659595 RepID=A0A7W8D8K2_9GAMM|nr:YafY family protein [Chiayiivirga flava]MBB5209607.1 putative DNA-binding transcriptional regulator YafY [Chiayiivirga flava]